MCLGYKYVEIVYGLHTVDHLILHISSIHEGQEWVVGNCPPIISAVSLFFIFSDHV